MLAFLLSVIGKAIFGFVLYGFCAVTVLPVVIATLTTLVDAVDSIDDWTSAKSIFSEIWFAFVHYWKDDLIEVYRDLRRSVVQYAEILAFGCVLCAFFSTLLKTSSYVSSSTETAQIASSQIAQRTDAISKINPAMREGIKHIIDVINDSNALPRWREVSEIEISKMIAEGKITEDEGNVMRISIKMVMAAVEPIIEVGSKTNEAASTSKPMFEIKAK